LTFHKCQDIGTKFTTDSITTISCVKSSMGGNKIDIGLCDCIGEKAVSYVFLLLIFRASSTFTRVLFYVAPPTVVQLVKSSKSYIELFVINCCVYVPKLLDPVKAFERYRQKCALATFLAHAVGLCDCIGEKAVSYVFQI